MIIKKLYTEKYRPKNIEGMILLPRIEKQLLDNEGNVVLSGNYLFTGIQGTGKTSLTNVIVPEGALKVNASYNSSVDDLKDVVIDYCRTADIFSNSTIDGFKIVYLDEFDGVSGKYQEALRGFIEEYSDRIRFIATCNNVSKITGPMLSRFNVINFDPQNNDESEFLKEGYLERALLVKEKNKLNVSDEQIKSIINISFPDFRSVLNALQQIEKIGGYDKNVSSSINVDLYNIIFSTIQEDKTFDWVIQNFGDRVENLLKMCGRPLAYYIFQAEKQYSSKVPKLMKIVNEHLSQLTSTPDPVVLALSCVFEIQTLIKTK